MKPPAVPAPPGVPGGGGSGGRGLPGAQGQGAGLAAGHHAAPPGGEGPVGYTLHNLDQYTEPAPTVYPPGSEPGLLLLLDAGGAGPAAPHCEAQEEADRGVRQSGEQPGEGRGF